LLKKGFKEYEIHFEYIVPERFIVDCVGIKKDLRVAIECGGISGVNRIKQLKKTFDEVIHLKYKNTNRKTIPMQEDFWNFIERKRKKNESLEDCLRRLTKFKPRKEKKK